MPPTPLLRYTSYEMFACPERPFTLSLCSPGCVDALVVRFIRYYKCENKRVLIDHAFGLFVLRGDNLLSLPNFSGISAIYQFDPERHKPVTDPSPPLFAALSPFNLPLHTVISIFRITCFTKIPSAGREPSESPRAGTPEQRTRHIR